MSKNKKNNNDEKDVVDTAAVMVSVEIVASAPVKVGNMMCGRGAKCPQVTEELAEKMVAAKDAIRVY